MTGATLGTANTPHYPPDPHAARIGLEEWRKLFGALPRAVRVGPTYLSGTPLETPYLNEPACFADEEGDSRLQSLTFDNSLASLRLWSFLLSEEQRLHRAHKAGRKIIGALKDLGTVPVMAYSVDSAVAFYPDGAWWIPCIMELSSPLLKIADSRGIGEEGCPARAALSAFLTGNHFPKPDLCIGAVGSCCDDFSCVMQAVSDLDIPFVWWELPYMRPYSADARGPFEITSSGLRVPLRLVNFVERELETVRCAISNCAGEELTEDALARGIAHANRLRSLLASIRDICYGTCPVPFPALETQICEMLALHFCSDRDEAINVLEHVLQTVARRAAAGEGVLPADNCRVVWVNPVADLRVMNMFEELGGSIAGTEYLFRHALEPIRTDIPPLRALALSVLSDPMIGPSSRRAAIVVDEAIKYRAEGVVISAIPGASHCATESRVIREIVSQRLGLPVLEISVPPLSDSLHGQLATRFEAFFELIRSNRSSRC